MAASLPRDEAASVSCSLDAAALAERAASWRNELFASVREVRELADGYAFRFAGDDRWKALLFDFVNVERTCCSFFKIELSFEPGLGPIWLRLTGSDGTKQFIEETFLPERDL